MPEVEEKLNHFNPGDILTINYDLFATDNGATIVQATVLLEFLEPWELKNENKRIP